MPQLTYADRERLLSNLDTFVESWCGTDEELLSLASRWVEQSTPTYGYERALSRDVLQLAHDLQSHPTDAEIVNISRGALLQVIEDSDDKPNSNNVFRQLGKAFACRYAVHEIRRRLGEEATFALPRLTAKERSSAETLFLNLLEEQSLPDTALSHKVKTAIESLGSLADSSLFHRFRRQIALLTDALGNDTLSEEQRTYARGALAYFVCEEDAIDDRWGLVGLVDDCFIAQLAIDLVFPTDEPWADLLDAAVSALPYMNNLLLEDNGSVQLPSEYQIINSALASSAIRGREVKHLVIVTPSTGPTPFLISVSAAIGLGWESSNPINPKRFHAGQKVKVDYGTVAEFAGYCNSSDGRPMFKLRTYYQERGQRQLGRERPYPISEIGRLVPASSSLSAKGQLPRDRPDQENPLPGLDYLFASDGRSVADQSTPRVMVIASAAECRGYADSLALNGLSLRQVLPMGHLSSDAETIVRWTTRFGVTPPLLLFASDADAAYEYAANNNARFELLVVDGAGRCINQLASLDRLKQWAGSTIICTDERRSEALIREDDSIWEWNEGDLTSLVWPSPNGHRKQGIISHHECKLRQQARTKPQVETILLDEADAASDAHKSFTQLTRQRGEDQLHELDRIATESFRLLSLMLRCAFLPAKDDEWTRAVEEHFQTMAALRNSTVFLSKDERSATEAMEDRFASFAKVIRTANPKAARLQSLLNGQTELTIVCPDTRVAVELQRQNLGRKVIVTPTADSDYTAGVVAPGWFRRARMTSILSPPLADPLVLLLYGCETRWHHGFLRRQKEARRARNARSDRSTVFPGVSGWMARQALESGEADAASESLVEDSDQLEQSATSQHLYRKYASTDESEGVPARLVLFEDGSYGLFTDAYRLNVVTHLLESPPDSEEEKETVYLRSVGQLTLGDAVVFGPSGRDIIRTLADTLLRDGQRDVASLWRKALCEHASRAELSLAQLTEQLRQAGCKVQQATVNNWLKNDEIIGPQAYRRDTTVIAEVTCNEELRSRLNDVVQAIADIRSAHLRASGILARKVRHQARELLLGGALNCEEAAADGLDVVQVADVDAQSHSVKRASTNRLIRGDAWLV